MRSRVLQRRTGLLALGGRGVAGLLGDLDILLGEVDGAGKCLPLRTAQLVDPIGLALDGVCRGVGAHLQVEERLGQKGDGDADGAERNRDRTPHGAGADRRSRHRAAQHRELPDGDA